VALAGGEKREHFVICVQSSPATAVPPRLEPLGSEQSRVCVWFVKKRFLGGTGVNCLGARVPDILFAEVEEMALFYFTVLRI